MSSWYSTVVQVPCVRFSAEGREGLLCVKKLRFQAADRTAVSMAPAAYSQTFRRLHTL